MKASKVTLMYFVTILWVSSLFSCAGVATEKNSRSGKINPVERVDATQDVETIQLTSIYSITMRAPLNESYDNIVFRSFDCSEQFQKDYPDALKQCKEAIISQLNNKKNYLTVTDNAETSIPEKSLLIDIKIIDMRIVSKSARLWGGVMAGASYMDVILEMWDADTNQSIHKKHLYSYSNPFGSFYTDGASDRNLPSDFGVLIGEYIFKLVPGTQ
jgi:hypothetical protein